MPSAMNCADLFVRFTLAEWSLRPIQEDAANTVRGFVSAVVDKSDERSPTFITVRLRVSGAYLVVEVHDDQAIERPAVRELPLPSGVTAEAVPLPRREARRSLVDEQMQGQNVEVDPHLVRRVLTGLTRSSDEQ
ncbi:ATP-binding protein [Amycolatopsis cihanbeyliensis]